MIRIATYNVEWFNSLFDAQGALAEDDGDCARHGLTRAQQIGALGAVFSALDADLVMVIEAPDHRPDLGRETGAMLEAFARRFGLRARRALVGAGNDTQQEIACLYDPARLSVSLDPRLGPLAPLSKPPLELRVVCGAQAMRLVGVHLKSKAPHGARDEPQAREISLNARRTQLAQAEALRAQIEADLAQGDALIVLGDFNDGPGLDPYEALVGRSSVEVILGERAPRLYDPNAAQLLGGPTAGAASSARFYLPQEKRYLSALIDYIMVSPDLRARHPRWRIWHPFEDAGCYEDADLRAALLAASDHFPVTLDLP